MQIKGRPGERINLYGDKDELYTTFSGVLLSPAVINPMLEPGNYINIAFSNSFLW